MLLLMQICTRRLWRNAMFWKRRFRNVWSYSQNLPVLSLMCAWARHRRALEGAKHSARLCCPLLKLLLIKKSIILTPCTSTQRKLENEQRKSHRILISSCATTDIRLFDFYGKRGLGPDQSHYDQSRLWSRLLAQIKRIASKWIYTVFKNFSPFTIFEKLALALKNQSCPEIFHCIEYTFYIQDF